MNERQRWGLLWMLHLHLLGMLNVLALLAVVGVLIGVGGLVALLEWEAKRVGKRRTD